MSDEDTDLQSVLRAVDGIRVQKQTLDEKMVGWLVDALNMIDELKKENERLKAEIQAHNQAEYDRLDNEVVRMRNQTQRDHGKST